MVIRSAAKALATALLSAAAGWALHAALGTTASGPAPAPGPASALGTAPARMAQAADTAPLISVSSDGNVTLRVEQQPLEWVLEQIAQQSGWSDVKARAKAAQTASATSLAVPVAADCAELPMRTPAQVDAALKVLQHGGDAERYQGLMQARTEGITVPDELLKTMVESDASDPVRLLAFEGYLEGRSGDNEALRTALQAALYVPNGAIQREAKKRLDELTDTERIAAASLQPASD